jgi:hypothetical protein
MVRLAADRNMNLGIGTPKFDYRIVYQLKYDAATFSVQHSLICYDSCLQSLYEAVWLDTPQHKTKRQIRPSDIISGKYQEVVDRHLSKCAEEKGKQVLKGNVKKESKKGK